MLSINIKQLLEAGVHFGHQTEHWYPRMKPYIFSQRNGIHVIDLQKTMKKFKEAYEFVKDLIANGGTILFVGTKKQAQDIIKEEAARCGAFYVKHRWLGGMLTNFKTIRKNVDRLSELERMEKDGMFEVLPQGEVKKLKKERDKLLSILEGVRDMDELPGAVFVVDLRKEAIAIAEANKLGIPVVGVVDTNCDPHLVTYCIPGNDDAIRGIKLFVNQIAEAVIEGKKMIKEEEEVPAGEGTGEVASIEEAGAPAGETPAAETPAAAQEVQVPAEKTPVPEGESPAPAQEPAPSAGEESPATPGETQSPTQGTQPSTNEETRASGDTQHAPEETVEVPVEEPRVEEKKEDSEEKNE